MHDYGSTAGYRSPFLALLSPAYRLREVSATCERFRLDAHALVVTTRDGAPAALVLWWMIWRAEARDFENFPREGKDQKRSSIEGNSEGAVFHSPLLFDRCFGRLADWRHQLTPFFFVLVSIII